MDIHKPKPWHGVREFLKEYLIIVVGVLTALGAEQLAETLHWRSKIEVAEHAMRLELEQDDGPQAYARLVAVSCFDHRLDELEALASARADRRVFRKAALTYHPPARTWDQQSWQSAVAADVGTHMGADELVRWSMPYRSVPALEKIAEDELHGRTALAAVRQADGPLSEAEADRTMGIIADLRADNAQMAGNSAVLIHAMKRAGVELTETARADVRGQARAELGACAHDPGQTPAKGLIDENRQFGANGATRNDLGLPPMK